MTVKKPMVWILALGLIVCAVVAVCLLTDPPAKEEDHSAVSLENAVTHDENRELNADDMQNGDFELVEKTAYYQLFKEIDGNRYFCVPADSDKALGAYTGEPKVTADGDFLRIVSDEGEHWYEQDSGWYWVNDFVAGIDRLFEKRADRILCRISDTVVVYDIAAGVMLAEVSFIDAYIEAVNVHGAAREDYIYQAYFKDDQTVEVIYYASEKRAFTFEIEDFSKCNPLVDPPKTAIKMPEMIRLADEAWTDAELVITPVDDYSIRFSSSENGEEIVMLSDSNIRRLNRLYESVTDFSASEVVRIEDGVEVTIRHDGTSDSFTLGAAVSRELEYYIDQLCRLSGKELF